MPWHFSVALLPSLLAGVGAAALAVLAWRHHAERTGGPFVALMLALSWWAIAYGIELGYTDPAAILRWDKIAFLGSVTVPTAMFLLGLEYAGLDDRRPPWTTALLALEPAATLVFVWTYPATHLVWGAVSFVRAGGLTLPVIDFGPWYWVNYAYSYLLIGTSLVLIASVYVRGSQIYRRQSALLILGAVIPLGANLLYNLFPGLSPFPDVDLTTFAMAVTGSLYALGLFRFKMLDLAPVARGMTLSEVGDGFAVLGLDGDVVEANAVGRRLLARDADAAADATRVRDARDGQIVTARLDGADRSYEYRSEPVTDFRDEQVGTLVVFRDITELEVLRRHEQRLAVMNRILRHNIRNEMNVVHGYGELLADSLTGTDREYAAAITRKAGHMLSLGEKARHIGRDFETPSRPVDVVPLVAATVDRARTAYPDSTIDLTGDRSVRAALPDETDLRTGLAYLLENAVEHHDADAPTVTVDVTTRPDGVAIAVGDDGPGIPPAERAVIESGTETSLEHGTGLGLWTAHWLVARADGHLEFADNHPRGSVVTILLPAADAPPASSGSDT